MPQGPSFNRDARKKIDKNLSKFSFPDQVYMPTVRSAFYISTFSLHKHCIHKHTNIICLAFAEGKICLKKQAITDYWNLGCKLDRLSEFLNPFRDERPLLTHVKKLLCGPPLDCSLNWGSVFGDTMVESPAGLCGSFTSNHIDSNGAIISRWVVCHSGIGFRHRCIYYNKSAIWTLVTQISSR